MRHRGFVATVSAGLIGLAFALALIGAPARARAFDAKTADQSVVRVVVFEIKNGQRTGTYAFGTGFVVAPEYVVTNNHVVDDSPFRKKGNTSERVVVDGSKRNLRPAKLVWASADLDLAVVRVPGLTRPALTLSGLPPFEYPGKGDKVWAIGFPGLADRSIQSEQAFVTSTLTQGVVGKVVEGRAGNHDKPRPVIQHNASINKGNSGGPLFDDCGTVVGVNTFGAVSTMQITRDRQGHDVAAGMPNTGIFYSPHIVSFIRAQKEVAALQPIRLTVSTVPCTHTAGRGTRRAGGAAGLGLRHDRLRHLAGAHLHGGGAAQGHDKGDRAGGRILQRLFAPQRHAGLDRPPPGRALGAAAGRRDRACRRVRRLGVHRTRQGSADRNPGERPRTPAQR